MMTRDRIFAARDPRGFRPLSLYIMGTYCLEEPDRPTRHVIASETCAFDLIGATYERDVSRAS